MGPRASLDFLKKIKITFPYRDSHPRPQFRSVVTYLHMAYQQNSSPESHEKLASIFRSVAISKSLKFVIRFENKKCVQIVMFLLQTVHLILPYGRILTADLQLT